MTRVSAWLLLAALVTVPVWADGKRPSPPRLTDVKLWYYPPEGKPVTVVWWQPDNLKIAKRSSYSRRGRFRIRAEMKGGFLQDGEVVNFLSIVFRDQNSNMYQVPNDQALVRTGVKDIYWSPPVRFASGDMDFQVAVWNAPLPKTTLDTSIVDRTEFLLLGKLSPN